MPGLDSQEEEKKSDKSNPFKKSEESDEAEEISKPAQPKNDPEDWDMDDVSWGEEDEDVVRKKEDVPEPKAAWSAL